MALSPPESWDSLDLTLKPFTPNKFDSDTHLFSSINFLSPHGTHGRIKDRRPHHHGLTREAINELEKVGHRSHLPDTQVGHTQCETQIMLPQSLTIGDVCIYMCLAASLTILILSIFSIYFIMFKNGSTTHRQREEREQDRITEPEPLCLCQ